MKIVKAAEPGVVRTASSQTEPARPQVGMGARGITCHAGSPPSPLPAQPLFPPPSIPARLLVPPTLLVVGAPGSPQEEAACLAALAWPERPCSSLSDSDPGLVHRLVCAGCQAGVPCAWGWGRHLHVTGPNSRSHPTTARRLLCTGWERAWGDTLVL